MSGFRNADPGVNPQLRMPPLTGEAEEHFDAEVQLQPLGNRLLIKREVGAGERYLNAEGQETSIIVPEQAKAEKKTQRGVVVRLGPDVKQPLNEGDRVVYARYAGQQFGDSPCFILREEDVIAKVVSR